MMMMMEEEEEMPNDQHYLASPLILRAAGSPLWSVLTPFGLYSELPVSCV